MEKIEARTAIKGLIVENFDIGQIFDNDGYHRDIEVKDFKDKGNGYYSMVIIDLGRSDKTVPELIEIQWGGIYNR